MDHCNDATPGRSDPTGEQPIEAPSDGANGHSASGAPIPASPSEPQDAPSWQCTARSRRSGKRCKRPATTGYKVCSMHGSGTRKRVVEGKRKPPGRPVTTGTGADPDRTRYGELDEMVESWRSDPELRLPEKRLALMQSLLDIATKRFKAGEIDEEKLLGQTALVVSVLNKTNWTEFRNSLKAAVALVGLVLRGVGDVIDSAVADPILREQLKQGIQQRLSQIRTPVGALI
jgi:hypothetical protein